MKLDNKERMKWFVTIVASLLLAFSTITRVLNGQEADRTLCIVFVVMGGFVWGANVIEFIKKIK